MITYMIRAGIQKGLIRSMADLKDVRINQKVFEYSYTYLMEKVYDDGKLPARHNEININTIAIRMIARKIN